MDCQNFTVSWGRYFACNWFVVLQYRTIHYFFTRSWGREFVVNGNPRNPRILIPHKQWWFYSTQVCLVDTRLLFGLSKQLFWHIPAADHRRNPRDFYPLHFVHRNPVGSDDDRGQLSKSVFIINNIFAMETKSIFFRNGLKYLNVSTYN